MASLLARAEQIRKLIKSEEELDSIPQEERDKIFSDIDKSVAANKLKIGDSTFSFKPVRNDLKLPVLINLFALILLAGLGYFLYDYFGKAENYIIRDKDSVITLENKLIETLKKESDEKISAKDAEIQNIQSKLEDMRIQQEKLARETEERIRQREGELQSLFQEELEKERQRLIGLGYSDSEIQNMMKEYMTQKEQEYQIQLAAVTEKIEKERKAQEETISSIMNEYQGSLAQAQNEKTALEESLNEKYAEMEQRLENEKDQALSQLEDLARVQEQEDFILNNIFSFYTRVNEDLSIQDYTAAGMELDKLEVYLNDEMILSSEAVQFRRDLDSFMVSSLRKLIASEQQKSDSSALLESAGLLAQVSTAVDEGNRYYEAGDIEMARQSYLSAITSIPALDTGYTALQSIDQQKLEKERQDFLTTLEQGNRNYYSKRYEAAINGYRQALEYLESDSDVVTQIIDRLVDAGLAMETSKGNTLVSRTELAELTAAKREQESRQAVIQGLDSIQGTLDQEEEIVSEKALQDEEDSKMTKLVSLFNTKLLIMEVLASESIQEQYPGLHDKMADYLEAYGDEKEKAGREAALKEIVELTEHLSASDLEGRIPTPEEREQKKLFLKFLGNLKNILEMSS